MKITIIAVGKIKEKFYRDAIAEYSKRLTKYCQFEIIEVQDEKTPDHASDGLNQLILKKEGERILNAIKPGSFIVVTAIEGKEYDSVGFSKKLQDICVRGKNHITFIIGGSLGIDEKIKQMADEKISFSKMTFPHQMMRLILTEQIYRGYRILNHEPYHK